MLLRSYALFLTNFKFLKFEIFYNKTNSITRMIQEWILDQDRDLHSMESKPNMEIGNGYQNKIIDPLIRRKS